MRINEYQMRLNENRLPVLIKERGFNYAQTEFRNSGDIDRLMREVYSMHLLAEEYVYVLAFNSGMHLIGLFQASHGCVNRASIQLREILLRALLCGACAIVLVHNHPSGRTYPSSEDINITERIMKACDLVGIQLLDHLIIGSECFSFNDSGILAYE